MQTPNETFAVIFLLVFLKSIPKVYSIQCYKCIIATYIHYVPGDVHQCKDFDYSEKFIVNCPNSTMCRKTITNTKIGDLGQINGTERDCAFQVLLTQNYKNGRWQQETKIIEAHEEGCHKINDKGFRTSSPNIEHCYCKGDLCNGGEKVSVSAVFWGVLVTVSLFTNIFKILF